MSNVSGKIVKNTSLAPGGAVNKGVMPSTLIGKLGATNARLNEDRGRRLGARKLTQKLLKLMQKGRNNVKLWKKFTINITIRSRQDQDLFIKMKEGKP